MHAVTKDRFSVKSITGTGSVVHMRDVALYEKHDRKMADQVTALAYVLHLRRCTSVRLACTSLHWHASCVYVAARVYVMYVTA